MRRPRRLAKIEFMYVLSISKSGAHLEQDSYRSQS